MAPGANGLATIDTQDGGPHSAVVLRQALDRLPEEQQRLLALRFGCGLGMAEIARALGTTEAAVRRLESSAVILLMRLMATR